MLTCATHPATRWSTEPCPPNDDDSESTADGSPRERQASCDIGSSYQGAGQSARYTQACSCTSYLLSTCGVGKERQPAADPSDAARDVPGPTLSTATRATTWFTRRCRSPRHWPSGEPTQGGDGHYSARDVFGPEPHVHFVTSRRLTPIKTRPSLGLAPLADVRVEPPLLRATACQSLGP